MVCEFYLNKAVWVFFLMGWTRPSHLPTLKGQHEAPRRMCVPWVLDTASRYLLHTGRLKPWLFIQMEPFSALPSCSGSGPLEEEVAEE